MFIFEKIGDFENEKKYFEFRRDKITNSRVFAHFAQ